MTGRDTGLKNDVVIDGVRYVLHIEEGALQWRVPETAEEVPGQSGDFVTESWLEGGHLGMGETEKGSEAGYYFSDNMDASQKGWIRLSPQVHTIASVTMLDGTNVAFFSEADSNGKVYVYCAYREDTSSTKSKKIDPSDDSVDDTATHVSANAADPLRSVRYNNKTYLPLAHGISRVQNMRELTTCAAQVDSGTATGTSATTLTDTGKAWTIDAHIGRIVTCGGAIMTVTSNTDTVLTGTAGWPGATPSAGAYTIAGIDTWSNNDTATNGFYGFTSYQEGSDAMMLRVRYPALAEKYSGTNPKTNADWTTTAINIGDPGEVGSDVGVCGSSPWIATRLGLFVFDGTRAMLRAPIERDKITEDSAGLGTFAQGDRIFYPHRHLWRVRGETALPIGPDNIEGYRNVDPTFVWPPYIKNVPKDLIHRNGAVSEGKWFYSIYGDDSANVCILAGRLREGGRALGASDAEVVWHTLIRRPIRVRGLAVMPDGSGGRRLYWAEPTYDRICYIKLAADGSPASTTDRGNIAAGLLTHTYTFPEVDFGLPTTLKEFHRVDVLTENWPGAADAPLQIQYARDGVTTLTNLSTTITADGLNKRFFTPSVDGYRIRLRLSITTGAAYDPATDDPHILKVVIHALPRPDKADIFKATINATETRKMDGRSHKGVRDTLKALENADPVTIKDLYGDTATAQVFAVSDLQSYYDEEKGAYALINVFMREIPVV